MTADVDPERIARARSGDASAFEALVEARVGPMTRTAMAILGREEEARDAVQDTLVTAWRELAALRDPAAFDAWLTRILVNRCRRGLRRIGWRRTHEVRVDALPSADEPRAGDAIGAVPGREALERAFERLSVEERTLLVHASPRRPIGDVHRRGAGRARGDGEVAAVRGPPCAGPGAGPGGSAMSELRDDELSAMLEARAGRMSASADREILAAVRDEMRAPSGAGAFAVVPVVIRGRGALPGAGWAVAALVAVLALAVAGGLPRSATTPASVAPVTTGSAESASPGSPALSGGPSEPGVAGPAVVSLTGLKQALVDGSLDGRLVLIDSTLRRTVAPCPTDTCAATFGLDLVGQVDTDSRPAQPAAPAQPGPQIASLGGTWVVVPHSGTLVLVGRLADPVDQPVGWSELNSRFGALILDRATALEPISGWLVDGTDGARVVTESPPLTDGVPLGGPKAEFTLANPALGIDPHAVVTEGPFLVRLGTGPQPEIVARYQPGSLVTVAMPRITCAEPPSGAQLQCEDAVAVAWAVDQGSSPIASVEFGYGSDGSSGWVQLHHDLASEDLRVTVRSGPDGDVFVVDAVGLQAPVEPTQEPPPTSTPASGPSFVTPAGLEVALAGGALDGHLVLIDGSLKVVPLPCPTLAGPDCFGIAVAGLEDVSTSWDGPLTQAIAASMRGELAFVVRGQALVFVGRIVGDLDHPAPLLSALASADFPLLDPFALTPVAAWLVLGGVHSCPMLGVGATPCPGPPPALTDVEPVAEGIMNSDLSVPVGVDGTVPGVVPARIVTPGPFLVRTLRVAGCQGMRTVDITACLSVKPAAFQVVAQPGTMSAVRVVMAPVTCPPLAGGSALTCEAAVAAALTVVPAGVSIVSIEFGGGTCPPWYRCGLQLPDDGTRGHVVFHLATPGPDLWVPVMAHDTGPVTASMPVPFPDGSGTPPPAP